MMKCWLTRWYNYLDRLSVCIVRCQHENLFCRNRVIDATKMFPAGVLVTMDVSMVAQRAARVKGGGGEAAVAAKVCRPGDTSALFPLTTARSDIVVVGAVSSNVSFCLDQCCQRSLFWTPKSTIIVA